ncbi:MAG: fla cluster protein FlaF [Halobacteria archaeon]|nr:fla cluster protein FlaF [Halobacteria archaeon]
MGFSVSASTAIIFIGVLIAANSVYGAWSYSQKQLETARDDEAHDLLEKRQTSVEIVATSYSSTTDTLTVNASNTGETSLSASETTAIVDGEFAPKETVTVKNSFGNEKNSKLWLPGDYLVVNVTSPTSPNRVKLTAENGFGDVEVR